MILSAILGFQLALACQTAFGYSWISPKGFGFNRFPASFSSNRHALFMNAEVSSPGVPVIKEMNKETNVASMVITLPGEDTQKAFTKACDVFNKVVEVQHHILNSVLYRPDSCIAYSHLMIYYLLSIF